MTTDDKPVAHTCSCGLERYWVELATLADAPDDLATAVSDSLAAATMGTDYAEAPEPSDEPGSPYVMRLTDELLARGLSLADAPDNAESRAYSQGYLAGRHDAERADAPAVEAAWEALTIELDEPQPGMTSWGSVQRHRPAIEAAIRAESQDLTEQWANRAEDAEAKLAAIRAESQDLTEQWAVREALLRLMPYAETHDLLVAFEAAVRAEAGAVLDDRALRLAVADARAWAVENDPALWLDNRALAEKIAELYRARLAGAERGFSWTTATPDERREAAEKLLTSDD